MTPRWLLLSEPESALAIMTRHAFLRMKFTQKDPTPGFGKRADPGCGIRHRCRPPRHAVRVHLEIQFERKLYFTLIILTVSRGGDFSEATAGVVKRARSGHHAVARKTRIGKIRMIGKVEEFRPELEPESLGELKLFEERKIETMESGTPEIARSAAQRAVVGLADGDGHRRSLECRGIEPLIHVVRTSIGILPWDPDGVAVKPRSSWGSTGNGSGLAILQRKDPVRGPAAEDGVHDAAAIMAEAPAFTEGQIVAAAEVDDFVDVEIAAAVIRVNAEARQIGSAECGDGSGVENVNRVGETA